MWQWILRRDGGFSNVTDMFKLLFALLWIKDLQPVSSVELTYSCDDVLGRMPDHVNLTLTTSPNGKRTFTLTHVDQFDLDTDLFTMTTNQDSSLRYQKEALVHDQNTAFYQDGTNVGVFKVVRTDRTMSTRPHLQFEGQFLLGNFTYTLGAKKRVRRDVTSSVHSPEVVYTLRKQARRKKHLLYDDVDSSNVSEDLKTTMKFLTPARRSRRAPATYYIDIAAVVDFKSYSSFLNRYLDRANALREILEYYSYVIAGVDLLYQGITSTEYRIRVRLIKVIVAEVASASHFTEDNSFGTFLVHVDAALDDFRAFLAGSGRPLVEPYDHAILFTMYDLRISSAKYSYWIPIDIGGKAVLGKMCAQDGSSSSLVKDEGEFSSIEVAAHELAHSLSAQHDGINNTCNYDDAYIMAPESSSNPYERNANAWRFSNCTLQYFGSFFQELLRSRDGASCLTGQIPKSSNLPDDNGGLRGLKYPARAQCRIRLGDESTLAYNERNDFLSFTPSSLCLAMWCKEYEWLLSLTHVGPPFPGTPCDDGKLCLYGECVHHPKAPKYVCVFGDVPNFNCSQEVSKNPVLCSSKIFKLFCCESCSAHHKALESENLHSVTSTMATKLESENLPSVTATMASVKEPENLPSVTATMESVKEPENLPSVTATMASVKEPENLPSVTATMESVKEPEKHPNVTTTISKAKEHENPPDVTTTTAKLIGRENLSQSTTWMVKLATRKNLSYVTTSTATVKEPAKIPELTPSMATALERENLPYLTPSMATTLKRKNLPYLTTVMATDRPISNVAQTAARETVSPKRDYWFIVIAGTEGVCIALLVLALIGCYLKVKAVKRKYKYKLVHHSEKCESTLL